MTKKMISSFLFQEIAIFALKKSPPPLSFPLVQEIVSNYVEQQISHPHEFLNNLICMPFVRISGKCT